MKWKILTVIFILLAIFSVCFAVGYFMNKQKTSVTDDQKTERESYEAVDATDEVIITKHTVIRYEYYDAKNQKVTYEDTVPDGTIIGYSMKELLDYIKQYNEKPPLIEKEKGFYEEELISFAKNLVVIRKKYDTTEVDKYYLRLNDYKVIIYYAKDHTIYEMTDIDARFLPSDLANEISDGMYLKDDYELFNFLETYSS